MSNLLKNSFINKNQEKSSYTDFMWEMRASKTNLEAFQNKRYFSVNQSNLILFICVTETEVDFWKIKKLLYDEEECFRTVVFLTIFRNRFFERQ